MIHYLNLVGAYIVCVAAILTATYLSTAFSLGDLKLWSETRFAFAYAWFDRFEDWKKERQKKRAADALARKREQKTVVTAQLVPAKGRAEEPPPPSGSYPFSPFNATGEDRHSENDGRAGDR